MKLIYRGNKNLMFKRDFAKDLIDKFNLNLVDYGFVYKYDPINPQDNLNWFLLLLSIALIAVPTIWDLNQ